MELTAGYPFWLMPYIACLQNTKYLLCVGIWGNRITFSIIAAQIITGLYMGRRIRNLKYLYSTGNNKNIPAFCSFI